MDRIKLVLKSYKFYLFLALFIGIFIRLYGLDIQSFWYDELFAVTGASSKFLKMFTDFALLDFSPPLYLFTLFFWVKTFGNAVWIVRLLSAIAGIATLFFGYFLAKKQFDKYIATSFTILLAFSGFAIEYSQEARAYSFLLLFSTILTLLWLNMLKNLGKSNLPIKKVIIYGIMCIMCCFTHYFGAILVSFQFIYLFFASCIHKKSRFVNIIKVFFLGMAIGILFLPWCLAQIAIFSLGASGIFVATKFTYLSFPMLIDLFINRNISVLAIIPFIFIPNLNWFLVFKIPKNISIISICDMYKTFWKNFLEEIKNSNISSSVQSLIYLTFCLTIVLFVVTIHFNTFHLRYFLIALPSGYLLFSILISLNPVFKEVRSNIFVFILSFIGLFMFLFVSGDNSFMDRPFYKPYKQQWAEATKYAIQDYNNDSVIFVNRDPYLYFYYLNMFKKYNDRFVLGRIHSTDNLRNINKKYSKIIIISAFSNKPDSMENLIKSEYKKCDSKDFYKMAVYKCSNATPFSN